MRDLSAVYKRESKDLEAESLKTLLDLMKKHKKDRISDRFGSGHSMKYATIIKRTSQNVFSGHLNGPDTDFERKNNLLEVKFTLSLSPKGTPQIALLSTDSEISPEQAINLVKKSFRAAIAKLKIHDREMERRAEILRIDPDATFGMNKDDWHGFYLKSRGSRSKAYDFDNVFAQAIEKNIFTLDFKKSCEQFGYDIAYYA